MCNILNMYRILNFICFSTLPFQSLSALEYMANWQKLCYIKWYTYLIKTIKIFIIRLSVNLPRRNGLNYLGTNGAMLVSCPCCSFVFSSFIIKGRFLYEETVSKRLDKWGNTRILRIFRNVALKLPQKEAQK